MAIILGIIGIILGIGLIVFLVSLVISLVKLLFVALYYIVKWALIIAVPVAIFAFFIYLFTVIGAWTLIVIAACVLVIWLIRYLGPETLENRVTQVFHENEIASMEDLLNKVEGVPSRQALVNVLEQLHQQGKVEFIEFGLEGSILFRWTEQRDYPQGVITTHLMVD
ncbi:hypothetical protein [Paenibacillus amylolyticus]|uniref:hypothetical protein n=1 Tax=Paenibacillus amylolyticus TaxID=1451 RepID=UPI00249B91A0|nr:hypothetical protein [Paenibacillus amylolyticus]WFA84708.1 hypothetical protein OGI70_27895 [Paenibacillus amylolyticus]